MANVTTAAVTVVVEIVKTTKDSLHVRWHVDGNDESEILKYQVSYQAIGSTYKGLIHDIQPRQQEYNIMELHESTSYSICVQVITGSSFYITNCINAATSSDYLSVSLGSTFGAFIALAIIIMFVMIARCQTNRKLARLKKENIVPVDAYTVSQNGDIEMSDVSFHIHDDTTQLHRQDDDVEIPQRKEFTRQQSKDIIVHLYPNGTSTGSPERSQPPDLPYPYADSIPDEEKGAVGGVGVSDVIAAGTLSGALFDVGAVGGAIGGFEVIQHPYANSPIMHQEMQGHLPYINRFTHKPVFIRHNFSFWEGSIT